MVDARPEDSLALPTRIDDVTPEWLTAALRFRYPGVTVTSVHVGGVIDGSATKVRLLLDYDAAGHAAGLPPTMLLKAGFGDHPFVEIVAPAYAREVRFYRELAPTLAVNLPGCHYAGIDEAAGQAVVLLEDLLARNCTFGRATRPFSPATAAAALDQLARVHARWWERPELEALDTYPGRLADMLFVLTQPDYWAACLARPRASAVPERLRDRDTAQAAAKAMWALDQDPPHTLIHADAHVGNTFLDRDGAPGFLDWATAMRGPWVQDVTYFLIGAITVDDRRAHERALLDGYLDALAAHGGPELDRDEAWLAYRRHVMHGFFWVVNPEELQPEDVTEAVAQRFSVAAADHDSLTLLGL